MTYPYPKYNDKPDTEVHVQAFLTTWQANHVSQGLAEAIVDASKIAEFGLSLEGQAASWYSQHNPEEFSTFMQLSDKFIRLFHWQVAQRELMRQFYVAYPEAQETVS